MFCIHCGAQQSDFAASCTSCGEQLKPETGLPSAQLSAAPSQPASSPPAVSSDESWPALHADASLDQPVLIQEFVFQEQPAIQATPLPTKGAQPAEEFGPKELSAEQPFVQAPTIQERPEREQPDGLTSSPPANEAEPTEEFGPKAWVEQPSHDAEPALADGVLTEITPASEPGLPIEERVTGPLPSISRTPWTKVLEPRFGVLGRLLPRWASIASVAIIVLAILILQLTGSDWAAGAMHAAIAAGSIALLLGLVTGIRTLAGMRGLQRFLMAGLAVLILLALSGFGLTQQALIHRVQGHSLEGQKQWEQAISEYQLAGEHAPASDDIARIYVERGEQFSAAHQYQSALGDFDTVLNNYGSAKGEVGRAQSDKIAAYLAMGKQAMQQGNYTAATMSFDTVLGLPYCTTSCQAQVGALDATAYYKLAETQLSSSNYAGAVNYFQVVLTRFPNSPEARQIHPDLAQALLGQGQQQLASDCTSAIPTYQQLSTQFADTAAGQQAIKALQVRQPVTGRFVGFIPHDPSLTPVVVLTQNLYAGISADQLFQLIKGAPTANIHSDGTFSLKPSPGTYDLVWGTIRSDGSAAFSFSYNTYTNVLVYVVTAAPLCPFDFGTIYQDIPTPP